MQILIADDHLECREMVQKALRATIPGCAFTHAEDGSQAWWALTAPNQHFDLVIMDINMPGVGGLEVLQRMRNHANHQNTPVIMCTGVANAHCVEEAANLHVNSYVIKPYMISELVRRVMKILQIDRSESEAVTT